MAGASVTVTQQSVQGAATPEGGSLSGSQVQVVASLGLPGPQGPAGETGLVEREAGEAIAAGQPVRANALGRFVLAQADSLAHAGVAAVAAAAAGAGFTCSAGSGLLELADWSAATGSAELVPGAEYFLGAAAPGQLTTEPPATGVVLSVGLALGPTTMMVAPSRAILL